VSYNSHRKPSRRDKTAPSPDARSASGSSDSTDPLGEYLSYSRLRCFHECPRKYHYKYVAKIEGDESRLWVSSGKSFHEWLEESLVPYQGASFPHQAMRSAPAGHHERAASLAGRIQAGSELLAVEREVRYSVRGVNVLGYLDLMYREPGGSVVICDVKTGGSPKIHLEQLEMYAWFFLEEHPKVRLEYQLVDRDETIAWRVGAHQRLQLEEALLERAQIIQREREFPPIPGGHCSSCEFFDECPDAGESRGKPKGLRLYQLTAAKTGAKRREKEFR